MLDYRLAPTFSLKRSRIGGIADCQRLAWLTRQVTTRTSHIDILGEHWLRNAHARGLCGRAHPANTRAIASW